MAVQIVALLVFAAVFVIAEVRRSHIGIVMFAAACGVGLLDRRARGWSRSSRASRSTS